MKTKELLWPNGNMKSQYTVDYNDNITGVVRNYYENGNIEYEGIYVDGKKHGEQIWYNVDGSIKFNKLFIKDRFKLNAGKLDYIDKFELNLQHGVEWL